MPPMPGWYAKPDTLEDLIDFTARRVLQRFGAVLSGTYEWEGGVQR